MAPAYKITYFNVTALAEPSRWILKYADIDFEDDRFEREQWPELKPKMPFGQVPVLTANGKQYHQSMAMARFFARQAKLNGKDAWEDLEIDSAVDTVNDLRMKIALFSYEQDAKIKESRKGPLFNETIPFYLERLDKQVKDNGGYLACNKMTWADLYFIAVNEYMNFMADCDLFEKYSNLQTLRDTIKSIPQIKKWIEERPKTNM